MWDDDTKLSDMAVAWSQIEFVNAAHGWPMDELRGFFSAWMKTKMTKRLLVSDGEVEGAGEGRDENRIILTLPFLTFIMLKGHSEHLASSSPVVLWQAQTLDNLVAPRYHHSSHYLAKPIPFDLCSWCTLFTIGRAPTCTSALVKETRQPKRARVSEWQEGGKQTDRERESVKDQRQGDNKFKETKRWRV